MLKREEKTLDPGVIKYPDKMLNENVIRKLNKYAIGDDEYKLKVGKYHTEGREGVPYRMLIIKKGLTTDEQVDLELELRAVDSSLCVIFKK
jgi:hypothetical protein